MAEDDAALRSTIALLLEKDGHHVVQARDGIDLLADLAWQTTPPEDVVVVTDVLMPMIGGLAVLRSLRREGFRSPFILMTSFATPALRSEVERLGAFALFDKPFDLDDLREVVRHIAHSRSNRSRPRRRPGRT